MKTALGIGANAGTTGKFAVVSMLTSISLFSGGCTAVSAVQQQIQNFKIQIEKHLAYRSSLSNLRSSKDPAQRFDIISGFAGGQKLSDSDADAYAQEFPDQIKQDISAGALKYCIVLHDGTWYTLMQNWVTKYNVPAPTSNKGLTVAMTSDTDDMEFFSRVTNFNRAHACLEKVFSTTVPDLEGDAAQGVVSRFSTIIDQKGYRPMDLDTLKQVVPRELAKSQGSNSFWSVLAPAISSKVQ